jgi:hypothetical protein
MMEAGMQRLMQLVNEKNSLVRRQMQLNIAEQVHFQYEIGTF